MNYLRRMVLLLTIVSAVLWSTPAARAFDAAEFWREPVELSFDTTLLRQGESDGIAWQSLVYTSEIYRDEPMRIFAYYAYPTAAGKHPGVVDIHGGGGGADLQRAQAFARAGYACLSFDWNTWGDPPADWRPGDPLPSQPHTIFGSLRYDDVGKAEDWGRQFFRLGADGKASVLYRAVMAGRRALSWLSRQATVDDTRLAVVGHSWGGFVAQLLAGVDGRVKAVSSTAAAGAWTSRYHSGLAMHLQELSPQQMSQWVRRYDPATYAARMAAPILLRMVTADFFASVDTLTEYWPSIAAPKSLQLLPGSNHFTLYDVETSAAWFDHWLRQGAAFPEVTSLTLTPGEGGAWTVRAGATGPVAINSASVIWTTSAKPWDKRSWTQRPLREGNTRNNLKGAAWQGSFTPLQAGGPLRFFVTIRDARGRVVSTLPQVQNLPPHKMSNTALAPLRIARTNVSPLESPTAWAKVQSISPITPEQGVIGEGNARLDALWDDKSLYLRLRVDDPSPWMPMPPGVEWWNGDSVHVRLRTESQAAQAGVPDTQQHVFYLAWYPDRISKATGREATTNSTGFAAVRGLGFRETVTDVNAVVSTVGVNQDKGYILTASLPWAFLDRDFAPQPGRTFRLALLVHYGDLATNEPVPGGELNGGSHYDNPEAWGLATLVTNTAPQDAQSVSE